MGHLKLYSLIDGPSLDVEEDAMKQLTMLVVFCLTGFALLGNVSGQQREPSDGTLEFIGPGDNELRDAADACGMAFGFSYVISQTEGLRKGNVDDISANQVKVTTFKGAADGTIGKGARQVFHREIARSTERCSLKFKAESEPEPYKAGKIMNWWDEPKFSPTDVLRDTYKFRYRFSLATNYPADAVIANFDRIADKGCQNSTYSRGTGGVGFDYRNGVGDPVYCIRVGENAQPVQLGCVPYRNGSKCTAFAVLQSAKDGDTVSALEGAKLLRERVDAIAND